MKENIITLFSLARPICSCNKSMDVHALYVNILYMLYNVKSFSIQPIFRIFNVYSVGIEMYLEFTPEHCIFPRVQLYVVCDDNIFKFLKLKTNIILYVLKKKVINKHNNRLCQKRCASC